jgi:hypothetical protein
MYPTFQGAYDRLPGETPDEKLQNAWVRLQNDVNCFIDSDLDKIDTNQTSGIKQVRQFYQCCSTAAHS